MGVFRATARDLVLRFFAALRMTCFIMTGGFEFTFLSGFKSLLCQPFDCRFVAAMLSF
jgi:hypothetical protein